MSGEESKPHCVMPKDPKDPRGCGGWCSGPNEICQRLDNNTVHCIDDSECLHDEWRCKNGLCIPEQRRCDGHFNCYDMTDEYNCECGSDGFHCSDNTSCLPLDRRCNGFVDCWDGSDEANCTALCPASQHTCNSGQCIPMDNFCDSYRDCDDGSDEPAGCDSPCLAHQRQCQNGRCVPGTVWCDGFDSCGDGSDEANCGSAAPSRDRSSVVPALPPGHLLGRLLPNTHRKVVHPQTSAARSHS
uniref:Putative low-density lipoprotein receptor n=1 Tax=Hyalomma excavatum TaxID=257692 RepID=A0A131XLH1_9ACAR